MGYLAVWKVLEEMIVEFRKKGITIPAEVIKNLKSANTMIKILKADVSRAETAQRIEEYLRSVESYLVSEGQKTFGTEFVEEWLRRLNEASRKTVEEAEEETRFFPGISREQKWIRVKPSAELPLEELKVLAKELGLHCKVQNDGCLLVYGKDKNIKAFVKKIATKYGMETEK